MIYHCLYSVVQSSSVEILGLVASNILGLYSRLKVVENKHGVVQVEDLVVDHFGPLEPRRLKTTIPINLS